MNQDQFPFIDKLEVALIAGFLQDRKLWVRMHNDIKLHYFNDKDLSKIFNIIKVFFDKYKEFPTKDVILNIAEKKVYEDTVIEKIHSVFDVCPQLKQQEIEFLYDECNKFIKNQKIKDAILESIDLIEKEQFESIETKIKDAIQWNNEIDLGLLLHEAEERYKALEQLSKDRLPWPWRRLNILNPGMLKKELYMVMSSSSVGKSIFLDNVAFYTWQHLKKNVVSITLELSELVKCKRMDAYGMKTAMNTLESKKDEVIKFYEENKTENRLFVKEFPTGAASVRKEFYSYLYNLELYAGLHPDDIDLIVVDYAGITKPGQITGNLYVDGGSVCEDLRAMAIEFDVPVLSADQFNRCTFIDTIVQTKTTREKIKIKDINVGDQILTNNGYNTVLAKTDIIKQQAYKIKTKSGKEIICSANHIFPTTNGDKSINTGLQKGDKLFVLEKKDDI